MEIIREKFHNVYWEELNSHSEMKTGQNHLLSLGGGVSISDRELMSHSCLVKVLKVEHVFSGPPGAERFHPFPQGAYPVS